MEKILREISNYKKKIHYSNEFNAVNRLLKSNHINTICHSARCPNIGECFFKKKLTFMILGNVCTRNCRFCNVKKEIPDELDKDEPKRITRVVKDLKLKYVVITSVTRDDLGDGGCSVFLELIDRLKQSMPGIKIEILIPDFNGNRDCLFQLAFSDVDVIAHNIETVKPLYAFIRPQGDFKESLNILNYLKGVNPDLLTKSGFMVGLGESMSNIKKLLIYLYKHYVDIVTVGQYFQPSRENIPVKKYYTDEDFELIENYGRKIEFKYISAGRFMRSSYYAEEVFEKM